MAHVPVFFSPFTHVRRITNVHLRQGTEEARQRLANVNANAH
jgi:hypothetical protein